MKMESNINIIVFVSDPTGAVHPEITNKNGNPSYKYFYSNADHGETFVFLNTPDFCNGD